MGGTLSLSFRHRPGQRLDINRLVASVQEVFSANGVEIACSAASPVEVASPLMESLGVNGCSEMVVGRHRRLFATATDISSPDQVVVFVVRSIADGVGEFSGCALHPPGIPGLVLTEKAAEGTTTSSGRWVLAHELAHVLGLDHDDSPGATGSLMCSSATAITATIPALSTLERATLMKSGCLGQSRSGSARVRPFTGVSPRTTPERSVGERELPIMNSPRRTMFDDLN